MLWILLGSIVITVSQTIGARKIGTELGLSIE
jgi:hypothetical protein